MAHRSTTDDAARGPACAVLFGLGAAVHPAPVSAASTTAIRPGIVSATSMDLRAEYASAHARLRRPLASGSRRRLRFATRRGLAIDRLELSRSPPGSATCDRRPRPSTAGSSIPVRRPDDPLAARRGPAGGRDARSGCRLPADAPQRDAGSNWLFTRANGIVEAAPLAALDQPADAVHPAEPRRSVRDRGEPSGPGDDRERPAAGLRHDRRAESASGLTKTFEARNVRDFALTAATDYRLQSATVNGVFDPRLGRPGFPSSTVMAAAKRALAGRRPCWGPTRTGRTTSRRPPAATGWSRPA